MYSNWFDWRNGILNSLNPSKSLRITPQSVRHNTVESKKKKGIINLWQKRSYQFIKLSCSKSPTCVLQFLLNELFLFFYHCRFAISKLVMVTCAPSSHSAPCRRHRDGAGGGGGWRRLFPPTSLPSHIPSTLVLFPDPWATFTFLFLPSFFLKIQIQFFFFLAITAP